MYACAHAVAVADQGHSESHLIVDLLSMKLNVGTVVWESALHGWWCCGGAGGTCAGEAVQ